MQRVMTCAGAVAFAAVLGGTFARFRRTHRRPMEDAEVRSCWLSWCISRLCWALSVQGRAANCQARVLLVMSMHTCLGVIMHPSDCLCLLGLIHVKHLSVLTIDDEAHMQHYCTPKSGLYSDDVLQMTVPLVSRRPEPSQEAPWAAMQASVAAVHSEHSSRSHGSLPTRLAASQEAGAQNDFGSRFALLMLHQAWPEGVGKMLRVARFRMPADGGCSSAPNCSNMCAEEAGRRGLSGVHDAWLLMAWHSPAIAST